MSARLADFIVNNTSLGRAELVPEITLHLATDSHRIFQAAENLERPSEDRFPPYWAFAWPGGQAIARYILDNPALFAGKRIVDIGSGSGLGAIAAALAGASDVLAADIDPMAETAIRLNLGINDGSGHIATTTADLLGDVPDVDVIIISDLVYEPDLVIRVGGLLERASAAGILLLVGDRTSGRRPAGLLDELACYPAPLMPSLIDGDLETGRVWRVRAAGSHRGGRASRKLQ
jgi:predicted nicotinamide N-methyase